MARETTSSQLSPAETQRWTRIGTLAAFAMLLGYLETFIPIPLPGVKLGLANIAVLIALAQRDAGGAFAISVIKVLAAGLLFGSPITMAYSAAGTALAFAVMAPLSRLRTMHVAMVSVAGALMHEIGQLFVAMVLLGTPLVWYSAPLLLAAGCITGALCGIVAARTLSAMKLGDGAADGTCDIGEQMPCTEQPISPTAPARQINPRIHVHPKAALVALLLFAVAVLHLSSPVALAVCLAAAALACLLGRVGLRSLLAALMPVLAILAITLVAQVASNQQGTVIATLGPVNLTLEALQLVGVSMLRLLALTAASLAVMHLVATHDLVAAITWLLHPLERYGVGVAGFALALNAALETVPLLAASARQMPENAHIFSKPFWSEAFPSFIAGMYRNAAAPGEQATMSRA